MSTRCLIGCYDEMQRDFVFSYKHSNGSLGGVGETLLKKYNDYENALKVAESGSIDNLEEFILEPNYEGAYPVRIDSLFEVMTIQGDEDYIYLFMKGHWYATSISITDEIHFTNSMTQWLPIKLLEEVLEGNYNLKLSRRERRNERKRNDIYEWLEWSEWPDDIKTEIKRNWDKF